MDQDSWFGEQPVQTGACQKVQGETSSEGGTGKSLMCLNDGDTYTTGKELQIGLMVSPQKTTQIKEGDGNSQKDKKCRKGKVIEVQNMVNLFIYIVIII